MKFKKYMKESVEPKLILDEGFNNPDAIHAPSIIDDELESVYGEVDRMIAAGDYAAARTELDTLTKELDEFELENSKKRIFKFPAFMIEGQRKQLTARYNKLPTNESVEDMDKRCENCNTLLSDNGTCPKCDEGDEDIREELSNKEKLQRAYPELNFDAPAQEITEEVMPEELSVREKLKKAYPELNFDAPSVVTEELSNREKLLRAYPELNFDSVEPVTENCDEKQDGDEIPESWDAYDDEYEVDDVELDRRHAALYGGDRMYCNCGAKLRMNEYGSFCPNCEPEDPENVYDDRDSLYDDEI